MHPCPVGKYCPIGLLPIDCPLLTYRDKEWGKKESDCFTCPAGYWCNHTGMSSYNGSKCPIGHYCSEGKAPVWCPPGRRRIVPGAVNANECGPCPQGFYCPYGSGNFSGIPCENGTYCPNNVTDGAALPTMCPSGYFCPVQSGNILTLCPGNSHLNISFLFISQLYLTIISR